MFECLKCLSRIGNFDFRIGNWASLVVMLTSFPFESGIRSLVFSESEIAIFRIGNCGVARGREKGKDKITEIVTIIVVISVWEIGVLHSPTAKACCPELIPSGHNLEALGFEPGVERFKILILIWVSVSCLNLEIVDGYYLPGSFPHRYYVGDQLSVKVNSLTSIDTEIPYGYYTLPFCRPLEGIKDSAENLGELLMGDRIENSPYRFKMYKNESEIILCKTNPLSSDEFKTLKKRIDEMYQVNLNLDNLPAIRYMLKDGFFLRWIGYPVGIRVQDVYYVFNHLKFKVLVHKYEHSSVAGVIGTGDGAELITSPEEKTTDEGYVVVGFEVVPCSVNHDLNSLKNVTPYGKYPSSINCDPVSVGMSVKEGTAVSYTYEVSFVMSDIKWPSRWDAYLKMEGARVHWFSIFNSLMVITFLAGIVLVIFLRTIRRDLARYEELDKEAQAQMNEELSGWKLVVSDVFRSPNNPELLCIMVADGCRILVMAVALIFFAALGFMSPASRGTLITDMAYSLSHTWLFGRSLFAQTMADSLSYKKNVLHTQPLNFSSFPPNTLSPQPPGSSRLLLHSFLLCLRKKKGRWDKGCLGSYRVKRRDGGWWMMFLDGMLVFYVLLGVVAGYIAVWLLRTLSNGERRGWFSISWRVACFFPGISFIILTTINSLLWGSHSTGAIPFTTFLVLILLWFGISVPLTLIGGFVATRSPYLEYPVRTNQIPREIPSQRFPSWLMVLGAGTLPFGTLFIELFFIMSSIWLGRAYYVFGFLFVVLILLVIVCAEVSLVLTYMHLCIEDWRWWWKSFFASGSVAFYIFLYSLNYLIFDLKSLSGPVSAILYLGYSLFMVIAVMLATGAVGFLTSFFFVHRLFSSVKID
ncbi:hypothetical protein OSB04_019157 [Centaurea solstitialis]|uniref:Transmembrane 9 superfamily member n=1 Tax=Centaurea solstitialis TaxID=347529 RepID=A0AA38SPS5_9ASTR|nr:hypothetical protein OSB04_019157 [Centaurea solstitialis]